MRKVYILFFYLFLFDFQIAFGGEKWQAFKKDTLLTMSSIDGWCTEEKANQIMNLIKRNNFETCIEIGVFAGKSLFPIAKALQYKRFGIVFAIDAWDPIEAIKGFNSSDPNYNWWITKDYRALYQNTRKLIKQNRLENYCQLIKKTSKSALKLFNDRSIDFIHFDGNPNRIIILEDLLSYFPKVKDGGIILLSDSNFSTKQEALVFLMERADLISDFTPDAKFYLFRKNRVREQNALNLLK